MTTLLLNAIPIVVLVLIVAELLWRARNHRWVVEVKDARIEGLLVELKVALAAIEARDDGFEAIVARRDQQEAALNERIHVLQVENEQSRQSRKSLVRAINDLLARQEPGGAPLACGPALTTCGVSTTPPLALFGKVRP